MVRTQIYLPQKLHKKLARMASRRGQSMAGVIREYVQKGMAVEQNQDQTGKAAIRRLCSIQAKGGPKDLSKNLDKYLYG